MWPSGGAFATRPEPIVPPAPVTFSTTTCWPKIFDIGPATSRATVSDGPPAWNGATMVTNRVGKSCARAPGAPASCSAAPSAAARPSHGLIIGILLGAPAQPALHLEHVDVARGLLVPGDAQRRAHRAPHRLGDG